MSERCWAEIDLNALRHNAEVVRQRRAVRRSMLEMRATDLHHAGGPRFAGGVSAFALPDVFKFYEQGELRLPGDSGRRSAPNYPERGDADR